MITLNQWQMDVLRDYFKDDNKRDHLTDKALVTWLAKVEDKLK